MINKEDLEQVYSKAESSFKELKDSSVFITGGTGFFGKWLLESFIYVNAQFNQNTTLYVLSRNPERFKEKYPTVNFIKGDITSFDFIDINCDYIIHAADDISSLTKQCSKEQVVQEIKKATTHLLEFAKFTNCKQMIITSSGAVYNNGDKNTPYAEGKRTIESLCSTFSKQAGIEIKIARCFAFLGPYLPLDKQYAAGNFLNNALRQEDIIIKGDGTPHRSYMYPADLIIWLLTILTKGRNLIPYDVGSDVEISIEGLAKLIAYHSNGVKIEVQQKAVPGKEPLRYIPSVDLVKKELNLEIYNDLETSVIKTLNFLKEENENN